jgi:HAD superfamily hydrolase (TIGR01509 family)
MRSTRIALTLVFLADGAMVGSWASRIPAVQERADLTSSELGLALFTMSFGALVSMPLVGWLDERVGSSRVVVAALLGGGGGLWLASLAGGLGALAAALFALGASFGAINVAANAQGLALERGYERSIFSSFHAAFSAGGLTGAALGGLAAAAGVGARAHFAAVALALALVALVAGRRLLPRSACAGPRTPVLVRPPRVLLLLGAAAFFTLVAEGAAIDWSAVYLQSSLGTTAGVAALGYTAFSLAMVASRLSGDRLNERLGPAALARGGALLAAAGLAAALALGTTPAALAGFAAMGAGLGVVVPVLFRAGGSTPGVSAGVGIAAVSTVGWLGFLAGPPAIGVAADAVGLRTALGLVVAASALAALLSWRAIAERQRPFRGFVFEPAAVLSDLDGVLVDSGAAIERTWREFARRHALAPAEVVAASHGRRSVDLIRLVAPHLNAEAEAARVEQDEIDSAPGLRPLPGARELVESVPADRFAIVTSGTRALAVARLNAAGLPVPAVLVTADEVEDGKPHPEGYLRAAELLGVDPAHSVVLEDAPAGVEAGRAAGMTVIAVLTTNDESALARAHSRVRDLRALTSLRARRAPPLVRARSPEAGWRASPARRAG